MSTPKAPSSVAVTPEGTEAVAATKMEGGMMLSPLPLSGGRRKTRRMSKKMMKMMKKMTPKQLRKMMKGGESVDTMAAPETVGARRKSRKSSKKSRRGLFY